MDIRFESLENTGIAVVYAGRSDPWAKLDATLFDSTGTQVADTELGLSFTRQKALFVDEIFKTYFDAHPGDFRGTVTIDGTLTIDGRFFVLGLIQKRSNGALIAVPAHPVALSH